MWHQLLISFVFLLSNVYCFTDVGKWDLPLSGKYCEFTLAKSLFEGTVVNIRFHCDVAVPTNVTITFEWGPTMCSPDYFDYYKESIVSCQKSQNESFISRMEFVEPISVTKTCTEKNMIYIPDDKIKNNGDGGNTDIAKKDQPLTVVNQDGVYVLRMSVESKINFSGSFRIEMHSPKGYLSAAIYPLLPFFGVMCGIYTVLTTCWLIVCGLQWRDLLRIQYWIGAVALLGMIESSTFYGVYSSINNTGYFSVEVYMLAEFISIGKRVLARMLVIIVSLGFGIVKPRLGPAMQRVVGTGVLWGFLSCIEAYFRLHHKDSKSNKDILLANVPLAFLDSAISWWVFVSLAHTMRTLQLRRNTIKLSLYKHFTNTLLFAVVSSVVFMLYSIKMYRLTACITEWRGVWVDEGYWHMLFASILAVIMVLWRPTNNNQRYAFTPLLDNAEDDDDEEEEQFVNDAYGVKMRGTSINATGSGPEANLESNKDAQTPGRSNSLEADLRWVEENIPTSTLPLLDSDEEIINTKFEVSKMQ